jgi:hypothetical protein
MNRAERRKNKLSAEKPKTYVLTKDQIEQMKRDAVIEATRKAFLMFMSIPIVVLHDKFGFGVQRLSKLMHYALSWYESVQEGETDILELVKVAEKECGIQIMTHDYFHGGGHK